jgi:hypothetical protein
LENIIVSVRFNSINEKDRNKLIEGLDADFSTIKSKSKIVNAEMQNNRRVMHEIINDVSRNIQDVKLTNILIYIYGKTKREMQNKFRNVKNIISYTGCQMSNLNFRQKNVFSNMQPFQTESKLNKDIEILLTTDSIGYAYP